MKTEIDEKRLVELHEHIKANKNINREGIAKWLEEDAEPWVAALKEKYPKVYGDPEPEPEPAKKKAKVKEETTEYFLVVDGIKQPLVVKATKNNQILLETIEPKDEVEVKIKGVDVTIDLLKLEKESAIHGIPVAQLELLGAMARA